MALGPTPDIDPLIRVGDQLIRESTWGLANREKPFPMITQLLVLPPWSAGNKYVKSKEKHMKTNNIKQVVEAQKKKYENPCKVPQN